MVHPSFSVLIVAHRNIFDKPRIHSADRQVLRMLLISQNFIRPLDFLTLLL